MCWLIISAFTVYVQTSSEFRPISVRNRLLNSTLACQLVGTRSFKRLLTEAVYHNRNHSDSKGAYLCGLLYLLYCCIVWSILP